MDAAVFQKIVYVVLALSAGPLVLIAVLTILSTWRGDSPETCPDASPTWLTCPCCGEPLERSETYSDGRTFVHELECVRCGFSEWYDADGDACDAPTRSFARIS